MLSSDQKKRYVRNIAVPGLGMQGQEALLDSKVLVVGAGGLGSALSYYLAAAGIGEICVVDGDRVELSNLQRQIIHNISDIGRSKAVSAVAKLSLLNDQISIKAIDSRLDLSNVDELVANYDIIADATDNFETRLLLNKACYHAKKILVSAAVIEFVGHICSFDFRKSDSSCYQCYCPSLPDQVVMPTCSNNGVLGSCVGVIGSIQATEVVKWIIQFGEVLDSKLMLFDALKYRTKIMKIVKDPACAVCGC